MTQLMNPNGLLGSFTEPGAGLAFNGSNVYFGGFGASLFTLNASSPAALSVAGNVAGAPTTNPNNQFTVGQIAKQGSNLTYANTGNFTVDKALIASPTSSTYVAGTSGSTGASGIPGVATSAVLGDPRGVATDGSNTYIADGGNSVVYKVTAGGAISRYAGTTNVTGGSGDGGPASSATLTTPQQLALDTNGNLYIADYGANTIRMVDSSGFITTVAGAHNVAGYVDGASSASRLNGPTALAVDAENNLFIADANNCQVRKLSTSGVVSSLLGSSNACGWNDNVAASAAISSTTGAVAVNGSDVYFYDAGNKRIRLIQNAASGSTNSLNITKWTQVPASTRHRFTFDTTAATTADRLTIDLGANVSGTPTITETYGLSGASASLSGTVLTINFTSASLPAGVKYSVGINGLTFSAGAAGQRVATSSLFNGASQTGFVRSNVMALNTSGLTTKGSAGYATALIKSGALTINNPTLGFAIDPSGTATDTAAASAVNTSNQPTTAFSVNASALARSGTPAYSFGLTTPNISTYTNTASLAATKWGLNVASTTGTLSGSMATGRLSGFSSSYQTVATGAATGTTATVAAAAKVDWYVPAGTYTSKIGFRATPEP